MKDYRTLAALPASAYLNPANFATDWDSINPRRSDQYLSGLEVGRKAEYISIGINSVWGAKLKDGASLSSSEGIGYHAHTEALLRGFLDSGCPLVVYRTVDGKIEANWLRPMPSPEGAN